MAYEEVFDSVELAVENGTLAQVISLLPQLRVESEDFKLDLESLVLSASRKGHFGVVEYLLSEGAVLDATTPILAAKSAIATDDRYLQLFKVYLEHGWDVNTDHRAYGTALMQSLCRHNLSLVKYLVSSGADVNMENMKDSHEMRQMHRLNGASLGTTPLDIAAACCDSQLVQELVDCGARLEYSNALHAAAAATRVDSTDRISVLQLLLNEGMDVNAIEHFGADSSIVTGRRPLGTPLHYAAKWGHVDAVRFLLAHGADSTIEGTQKSGTALDWAKKPNDAPEEAPSQELLDLLM